MNNHEDIKVYHPLANREYKSSVFTSYFSIPEHAADLYRSLSGDPTVQPQDISVVTLEYAMYKTKQLSIPTPEFYIFYNGTSQQPTESILKLSDSYIEKVAEPMLDLTVRMININPVNHHPLLQKSRSLYEYSFFVQKVRDYQKPEEPLTNAIETAMHDCIKETSYEKSTIN